MFFARTGNTSGSSETKMMDAKLRIQKTMEMDFDGSVSNPTLNLNQNARYNINLIFKPS